MSINKFLKDIQEASQSDKLAIFIGSGVSRISGMPSWYKVVESFANDLGITKFSEDDFLEIPEKYYNKFDSFEYNQKLEQLLNEDNIKDLDVQKAIFCLNPTHIITTNWDKLLEKTLDIIENAEYSVVTNDNELSNINNQKVIIKMHGCISNIYKDKNAIVMKYSDYFNYNINFPLIDTYVKSIFATKRVLFLGYSLSDKNVKDILEFIKNRTKHHIYPYFITFDSYDKTLADNFANQGIFVIFMEQLIPNINDYDNKYKSGYLELIKKIQTFDNNSTIEKINTLLSKQKDINFISPNILAKYLQELFGVEVYFGIYGDNCLYFQKNNNKFFRYIKIFIKRLAKNKVSKLEKNILILLNSSNISCLSLNMHNIGYIDLKPYYEKYLNNYYDFNYLDEILNFDFDNISEYINKKLQKNININDELILKLQKAFILYKQEKYSEAIMVLKDIKILAFKNKKYFFNGIAKVNIQNLCRLDKWVNFQENEYCKEFNLKEELNNISSKYLDDNLKEIITFEHFYKEYFQIQKLVDENIKTAKIFEAGGSSANNHHIELYHRVFNIFLTINYNYLSIEMLNEIRDIYQKSFQALVQNFSIKTKQLTKNSFYMPPQKLDTFNSILFYIGVISSEAKELNLFLSTTLPKQLVFSDIDIILRNTLPNIANMDNNYFANAIVILSHTKLKMYQIFKILKLLTYQLSKKHNFIIYDILNYFLVNQFENFNSKILLKVLENLFCIYIEKFFKRQVDRSVTKVKFFHAIVNIFFKYNYKLKIEKEKINIFLTYVDKMYIDDYKHIFKKLRII